ncbi:hypothetical protein CSA56_01680 [candidate division KSB3 bacterium]|uniref:Carbohydrate-binding domain-containing protein n=1 Tax=candidate division KSB3 bacterium TaxID=2044937 RepID=A0A2G6KK18_9BACT|nr:MAG: hypothetical protein CSA56_01680 [candidate division KSB3 bacterium]
MRYGIVLMMVCGIWIGWAANLPAVEGDAAEQAVAHFEEHGIYDPRKLSAGQLFASINSAYLKETDPARRENLARRLLMLKWWDLWNANAEMAPETVLIGDSLPAGFVPSENWQWSAPVPLPTRQAGASTQLHYSAPVNKVARHAVTGTFPALLPANGTLLQQVYFPRDTVPDQIWIRVETAYAGSPKIQPVSVRARWTKQAEQPFATENRPSDFWAGTFENTAETGSWRTLSVDLVDLGLCGRHRAILGIEFGVSGNEEVWFGPTTIRRPQVEIRGTQPYHIFSDSDELAFDTIIHNFSPTPQDYELEITVSGYDGAEVAHTFDTVHIASKATERKQLTIQPGEARYLVFDYQLRQHGSVVADGYSAAAIIRTNTTGRRNDSKFGMMYWDQPGKEMVDLYEKLGVKSIVLFPYLERLNLFDTGAFELMPMLWSLPDGNPKEEAKLQREMQPYCDAGYRLFSNFWETDLRVPANMFAPHMRRFFEVVKHANPAAVAGIGGMAWFNVAYVAQLLQTANAVHPFFDFIAVMCYNTPSPPEYSGLDQENAALQTMLEQHDYAQTEIWNVEWSYFENLNLDNTVWLNTGVAREQIAPYTIRHHLFGFEAGISRMIPGTNLYVGRTPLAKNYGHSMTLGRSSVTRYDLTPLPLLPAYSTMTRMLEGKRVVARLGDHLNVICQVYTAQKPDQSSEALGSAETVLALWSLFGIEDVGLALPCSTEPVTVFNMLGEKVEQHTYNGKLFLSATPEPTYVLLPDGAAEHIRSMALTTESPLLQAEPKNIRVSPGEPSKVRCRVQLTNPAETAVRGVVKLNGPDWMQILGVEVRYENSVQRDIARAMLASHLSPGQKAEQESAAVWVGGHSRAIVTFDVLLPKRIPVRAYYEQAELTRRQTLPLMAEFVTAGQKVVGRTAMLLQIDPPLHVKLRPVLHKKTDVSSPTLQIELSNHSTIPRQGNLQIKSSEVIRVEPRTANFSLAPGETQTMTCVLTGKADFPRTLRYETVDTMLQRKSDDIVLSQDLSFSLDRYHKDFGYMSSFGIGEGFVFEVLAQDQSGYETRQGRGFAFRPAVKAVNPLRIDGQLDDWGDASPVFVNPEGRLNGLTFFAKDYGGTMQWSGPDDFSAAWQMMWDNDFLYIATRVYDEHWEPQHELGPFWNGDTFSLQIDPRPSRSDASIQPVPRNLLEIHSFDIGLSQTGPHIRRKYPSLDKPAGPLEHAACAIQAMHDGLCYEIAIPWDELSPLHPEAGDWMGVSLVWNEDDGHGRETSINWFGGAGGNGLAREPRLMGDVHFVE